MNKLFTKDIFVQVINNIEKQIRLDVSRNNLLKEVLHCEINNPHKNNEILLNIIVDVVKKLTGDYEDSESSLIEYYIWDLDFGKSKLAIDIKYPITINNKKFKLKTPSDLWDVLIEHNKTKIE